MRIAVIILFVLSWALPGFASTPPVKQTADAIQTQISNPIPFNAPSEHPESLASVAKVFFENPSFLIERLLDLPGQEIVNNPAISQNFYQYNVFYVQITAKAP